MKLLSRSHLLIVLALGLTPSAGKESLRLDGEIKTPRQKGKISLQNQGRSKIRYKAFFQGRDDSFSGSDFDFLSHHLVNLNFTTLPSKSGYSRPCLLKYRFFNYDHSGLSPPALLFFVV